MSTPAAPGENRVVRFAVHGHEFGFRRPSRADVREIHRRFSAKLIGRFGLDAETKVLNGLDGEQLMSEARCEVCLRPALSQSGTPIDRGEKAPAHWLTEDTGPDGKPVSIVAFDQVEDEELAAVGAYVEETVFKKKAQETGSSGPFAVVPISG